MIFVDSNIPMYLVGAEHPHKIDAQRILEKCISDDERLVTDAEVLQEILHRYVEIDKLLRFGSLPKPKQASRST
jgi:predicted nucleic acid-binding protein